MGKTLRVAMCDSNRNTIPPLDTVQATAWIMIDIAQHMVDTGCEVDVFAASGSKVPGRLVADGVAPAIETDLYGLVDKEPPAARGPERSLALFMYENLTLSNLYAANRRRPYDVIHLHRAHNSLHYAKLTDVPQVYTIHDEISPLRTFMLRQYRNQPNVHFVAISNRQRELAPDLPWYRTVYNGVNLDDFTFNPTPDQHLMFSARMLEHKGPHRAIKAAKAAGLPLKLYGNSSFQVLDGADFWKRTVQPMLGNEIEYKGYVQPADMPHEYGSAKALLMPISWEEPFGLVSIEAMACGTPVIGFRRGALPEIIVEGKTGFLVDTVEEMVEAIKKIDSIDRAECRAHVEKNFSRKRMLQGYESVYQDLAASAV